MSEIRWSFIKVPTLDHHDSPAPDQPPAKTLASGSSVLGYSWVSAWKWSMLAIHLATLCLSSAFWISNLRGKWKGLPRRWSVSHMQHLSTYSHSAPFLHLNGSTQQQVVVGDYALEGGVVWPRATSDRACCNRELGVSQEPECLHTYDYSDWGGGTLGGGASFLGEVDIAVLSTLALWISTSYAIFAIPNSGHLQYLQSLDEITIANLFPILWRQNWVVVLLLSWNTAGMVAILVARPFVGMTSGTMIFCAGSIVWNVGIHLFWAWVGKRTSTLLDQQVSAVMREREKTPGEEESHPSKLQDFQYWTQFMRLNEIAFSAPLLLVCVMSATRDTHSASDLQYIFGFSATSLSLLVPLDAIGVMMQASLFSCFG